MTIDISNHPRIKKAVDTASDARRQASQMPSLFSRVVNDAASKLASGADAVVDSVYELLPDREDVVSDIGSTSKAILEGADLTKDYVKALTSTPILTMIDDIVVPNRGGKITERDFKSESVNLLREMALSKGLRKGGSVTIKYDDYNDYGAGMSARLTSGSNEDVGGLVSKLADISPADELKMTLGEATISMDEEGNIVATDQYDFNNWIHFGKGTDSKGRYPSLSTEEFEASDISILEAVLDTVQNAPSDYQMVRNLAFLFGSRDYKDDTKDTGRKVEMNLGKLE